VERIVNLIMNHCATAESLFVVTFTDKAARELTTRVSNRLDCATCCLEIAVERSFIERFPFDVSLAFSFPFFVDLDENGG
ncbi:MAG: UvrD-helicase domain-containing protein, partial [Halieaceae bacterium]|nr:UvrD-helicase domain-containing protein [Halieaceae bacterium]